MISGSGKIGDSMTLFEVAIIMGIFRLHQGALKV